MNNIYFIVGNYGVGKSTIINYPIIKKEDIFLEIQNNIYVLGEKIDGADSLSKYKKSDILNKIKLNSTKHIIITGNYYCQYKDFIELVKYFKLHLIYLKTSFENNLKRIQNRDSVINVGTFNAKLKNHISLIKKVQKISKIHLIDNNRDIKTVKEEVLNIIFNETN